MRYLITRMIEDVIAETGAARSRRSSRARPTTCAVRRGRLVALLAGDGEGRSPTSRAFSIRACTATPASSASWARPSACCAISSRHYARKPTDLPAEWADGVDRRDEAALARRIADYIAGMTDRYALIEHARHFDSTPELR